VPSQFLFQNRRIWSLIYARVRDDSLIHAWTFCSSGSMVMRLRGRNGTGDAFGASDWACLAYDRHNVLGADDSAVGSHNRVHNHIRPVLLSCLAVLRMGDFPIGQWYLNDHK
jgi:hypothetical protein